MSTTESTESQPATVPAPDAPADPGHAHPGFFALMLGSIGVVYGDIGTSPLYALREAVVAGTGGGAPVRDTVLGILSLIIWALTVVVTLKYVVILLRADNDGEGGTLSLLALAQRAMGQPSRLVLACGIVGAGLFFGDALITPAISVLSAVEGLKLVTATLDPYVLPLTIAIIIALFLIQSRGTAAVAGWFGPITLVWFILLAVGGAQHIADDPGILAAFDPRRAVTYLVHGGTTGFYVLGAVFLAVTGAEALYADLGHFGRRPIQTAWIVVAFPCLALNYLGQGALILAEPDALENPFFRLYPDWALIPVVILATAATIIASQAVITGAFSLTRQAIQLKLLPRMEVLHTSESHAGQIYLPQVNAFLLVGVIVLCLLFGSSSRLATAYGIAVTGTMVVTATLAIVVAWKHWRWPLAAAVLLMAPFLVIDFIFMAANMLKVVEGGYVSLTVAAIMFAIMATWVRGTDIIAAKARRDDVPLDLLLGQLDRKTTMPIVPGTAVFLTAERDLAPVSLLHSLKHYKALHEKNVILTIAVAGKPRVPESERVRLEPLVGRFSRVTMTFGYMEEPNVPAALALCRKAGWKPDIMSTSFFLSRRSIRPAARSEMPRWQDHLFILLARNAANATDYFRIPTGRVVEIGTQVLI